MREKINLYPWQHWLALIMSIAAIALNLTFFRHSASDFISHRITTGSFHELAAGDMTEITQNCFYMRDYLAGKKLIIPQHYNSLQDIRFDVITKANIVVKNYPYILSDTEYAILSKNNFRRLKNWQEGQWPALFLSPDGNIPQSKEMFLVLYGNSYFVLPRDFFMHLRPNALKNLTPGL